MGKATSGNEMAGEMHAAGMDPGTNSERVRQADPLHFFLSLPDWPTFCAGRYVRVHDASTTNLSPLHASGKTRPHPGRCGPHDRQVHAKKAAPRGRARPVDREEVGPRSPDGPGTE